MKSKQKLVYSGEESKIGFQKLFATILPEIQKSNRELFARKQGEAKNLIFTDDKVYLKKIKDSAFKLLEYAGYADSRPNNNRDSLDNNSQQLVVLVN